MPSRRARLLTAFAVAVSLIATACGRTEPVYEPIPETGATLEGTVTYKNEPLRAGTILVEGTNGGATGELQPDGKYVVHFAPLGEVHIGVTTAPARYMAEWKAVKAKINGHEATVEPLVELPQKLSLTKMTGWKTTVKQGVNRYDIVIPNPDVPAEDQPEGKPVRTGG